MFHWCSACRFRVLPHVAETNDVCLFVGDGANKTDRTKIDETIQLYEDKIRKLGFSEITEVRFELITQTFLRVNTKIALVKTWRLILGRRIPIPGSWYKHFIYLQATSVSKPAAVLLASNIWNSCCLFVTRYGLSHSESVMASPDLWEWS